MWASAGLDGEIAEDTRLSRAEALLFGQRDSLDTSFPMESWPLSQAGALGKSESASGKRSHAHARTNHVAPVAFLLFVGRELRSPAYAHRTSGTSSQLGPASLLKRKEHSRTSRHLTKSLTRAAKTKTVTNKKALSGKKDKEQKKFPSKWQATSSGRKEKALQLWEVIKRNIKNIIW